MREDYRNNDIKIIIQFKRSNNNEIYFIVKFQKTNHI